MKDVENEKLGLRITRLKIEIKEKQLLLKELEEKYDKNKSIKLRCDEYDIDFVNKYDAKLHEEIKKIPEEERQKYGWNPKYSFKCNLCRKTFREGFSNTANHSNFLAKYKKLKVYSNYLLTHHQDSKCYNNQFCKYCEDNCIEYRQFFHKTERDRHMAKHKKDNIVVPPYKSRHTKEQVAEKFKQGIYFIDPESEPFYAVKPIEESETDNPTSVSDSSITSIESVKKVIKKRKKLKIIEEKEVEDTPTILDRVGKDEPKRGHDGMTDLERMAFMKKQEEEYERKEKEKLDAYKKSIGWEDYSTGTDEYTDEELNEKEIETKSEKLLEKILSTDLGKRPQYLT